MNSEQSDPAALRTLYNAAHQRGAGDVDLGLIELSAEVLAAHHAAEDLVTAADRVIHPRLFALLMECEHLNEGEARRRAFPLARNAAARAQEILDKQAEREAEARQLIQSARPAEIGREMRADEEERRLVATLNEPATVKLPEARPEMFSGLAGDVVRLFEEHTEADRVAIATQFLVAFGNAVGRGPHVLVGETVHHMNEDALVIGDSSRARKGDSKNAALRTLEEADTEWAVNIASGLSSGEGLIHAVRDPVEKTIKGERVAVDEGVADKRLLVIESEFSTALKQFSRQGNVLSNVLRDAFDGKRVLRTLTKASPTRATDAHVSVIAHTTPADLTAYLSNTEAANGLGNRFMCVLVHRAKLLPNPGRAPQAAVDALVDRVRKALDFARRVGEIRRTPNAADLWERVYPVLTADRPGLVGQLLARSEAHVTRLSALYALLAGQEQVDVEHIESGLAFWDYAEASTCIVFGDRTGNDAADRIRAEILPGEALSLNEIRERIFSDHISSARLNDAIKLLVATGDCHVSSEPTKGRSRIVVTRAEKPEKREKGATS